VKGKRDFLGEMLKPEVLTLENKDFLLIAGLSGAGKSTSLKYLEDLDFFCVDNLPPALLLKFAHLCSASGFLQVAVAADDSGENFVQELLDAMKSLPKLGFNTKIVFLDAPDDVLIHRFSASYRKHPLAGAGGRILSAFRKERKKLEEIRGLADIVIDTADMTPYRLKEEMTRLFFKSESGSQPIAVTVLSFGYKYGIPRDVDLLFDTRILPNPHYDKKLHHLDGRDENVRNFVFKEESGQEYINKIFDLLEFLLPLYITRSKSHLTIGIGCTGGRHRSVAVARKISEFLRTRKFNVYEEHRDLEKGK
jgi:RNase adapter protein RapZ